MEGLILDKVRNLIKLTYENFNQVCEFLTEKGEMIQSRLVKLSKVLEKELKVGLESKAEV